MRIIRWMCGHTILDLIRNEVIRKKSRAVPVEDKMREAILKWLDHIRGMGTNAHVEGCEKIDLP